MLKFTKMARKFIHVSLGACLGPMQGMGMNYNLIGVLARPQTFESWFLNPHKSKTHQKVIKGGIVSCHGTYMSW